MSSARQFKLGAILSYFSIFVNIITGLVFTPWVIRTIGKEDYGLYTLAMSVISLFLFDFGLGSAVTRFLSKYLAHQDQKSADSFLGIVYKLYISIDIILILVLLGVYFFIPSIYAQLSTDEIEKFKVVYAIAAIYSICSFPFIPVNGILTAHEKFVQSKLCDVINKFIIVVSMTICLALGWGLYALVLVNAFAGLITISNKIWCIYHFTKQRIRWSYANWHNYQEIASYSGWVTLKSLAQRCIMNIAPSILGILSGSTEIAVLGIAITLEGYTYMFSSAIGGMFLPKVSRVIAKDNDILPLMVKVGRIQFIVVGLIVTGVLIFGHEFIHYWVGDGFSDSYLCAVLMIIPSFIHLPQEIAHQTIYVYNKVQLEARIFCIMAIVNVVLAFALSPIWGAKGIGLSICIAYFVRTIGMDYIYVKYMNLDILSFFRESLFKMIIPLIFISSFGIVMNYLVSSHSLVAFVIRIILYTTIYFMIFYQFVMNNFEKNLILDIGRRIYKIIR